MTGAALNLQTQSHKSVSMSNLQYILQSVLFFSEGLAEAVFSV